MVILIPYVRQLLSTMCTCPGYVQYICIKSCVTFIAAGRVCSKVLAGLHLSVFTKMHPQLLLASHIPCNQVKDCSLNCVHGHLFSEVSTFVSHSSERISKYIVIDLQIHTSVMLLFVNIVHSHLAYGIIIVIACLDGH